MYEWMGSRSYFWVGMPLISAIVRFAARGGPVCASDLHPAESAHDARGIEEIPEREKPQVNGSRITPWSNVARWRRLLVTGIERTPLHTTLCNRTFPGFRGICAANNRRGLTRHGSRRTSGVASTPAHHCVRARVEPSHPARPPSLPSKKRKKSTIPINLSD